MLAFLMPQAGTEYPEEFLPSIREMERETGLDCFADLPPNVQNQNEKRGVKMKMTSMKALEILLQKLTMNLTI